MIVVVGYVLLWNGFCGWPWRFFHHFWSAPRRAGASFLISPPSSRSAAINKIFFRSHRMKKMAPTSRIKPSSPIASFLPSGLIGGRRNFEAAGMLVGVAVGVLVAVGASVLVAVFVGAGVLVDVGVFVLVTVGVAVGVLVNVGVLVGVGVAVGMSVPVAVTVGVGVLVGVGVKVGVFVAVGVLVAVTVRVTVLVLVAVGVAVLVNVGVTVGVLVLCAGVTIRIKSGSVVADAAGVGVAVGAATVHGTRSGSVVGLADCARIPTGFDVIAISAMTNNGRILNRFMFASWVY